MDLNNKSYLLIRGQVRKAWHKNHLKYLFHSKYFTRRESDIITMLMREIADLLHEKAIYKRDKMLEISTTTTFWRVECLIIPSDVTYLFENYHSIINYYWYRDTFKYMERLLQDLKPFTKVQWVPKYWDQSSKLLN